MANMPFELVGRRVMNGALCLVFKCECGDKVSLVIRDQDPLKERYPVACMCGAEVNMFFGSPRVARNMLRALKSSIDPNKILSPGRYQVTATAQGFQPRTSDPVYAGPGARPIVELALEVGPLQQDVVVTAESGTVLQSQTGAPVTVIDNQLLEAINKPDIAGASPRTRRADRAGGRAWRRHVAVLARWQLQLHEGADGWHARQRHRWRV